MKVALIHDWLTGMRGGEKVLEAFCEIFPDADIFTLLHNRGSVSSTIERHKVKTSFVQHFPKAFTSYRNYLPLFPVAIESFNLKGYDLILSSSHCVAKGVRVPKGAYHIAYCHTPMRYMWVFFDQYFGSYPLWKKRMIGLTGNYLKRWDLATVPRVNKFVSISQTIKDRIKDIYKRDSTIINPPVDVKKFFIDPLVKKEDYYLCVSALVPYKRIDVIVDAFNKLKDKKVLIIGYGNIRKELEARKKSDNIHFLGWVDDKDLIKIYQKAKAFLYIAEEDFGIAPVEAQAAGLPVICFGKGGVSETVVPLNGNAGLKQATGLFFKEQNDSSLIDALKTFEKREKEFNAAVIRANALMFSKENFLAKLRDFIRCSMKDARL